jgi:Ca2+-binding RTX toxin-like protein
LVSDARKLIAQNSSFFGVDTLDGIEQVDLHAQDAETLGYFAGFIQLGLSAGLPTVLLGGSANRGAVGNDSLVGTAADDQIYGLKGSDTILGLAGNDSITIADDGSSDQIDGGEGWDNLTIRLGGGQTMELRQWHTAHRERFGFAAEASAVSTKVDILDSVFAGGGDQIFLNVRDGTGGHDRFQCDQCRPNGLSRSEPNPLPTFVGGAVNSVLLLPTLDNAEFKISDYRDGRRDRWRERCHHITVASRTAH